jgi:hypothetical protein
MPFYFLQIDHKNQNHNQVVIKINFFTRQVRL